MTVELGRRNLAADLNPLGPLNPRKVWDTGNALLIESGAAGGDRRFHTVANVTVGPIDFTVRLAAPTGVGPGFATKDEALLALKAARTLATGYDQTVAQVGDLNTAADGLVRLSSMLQESVSSLRR